MPRVKLVRGDGTHTARDFQNQFPDNRQVWGDVTFTFDREDTDYDWLAVVDKLTMARPWRGEKLACPPDQTILITTEPSRISYYGEAFAGQFAYLISNHDASALPHPNAWRTQPGSRWFYDKPFSEIADTSPPEKTKLLSAIATDKRQSHTLHNLRFEFLRQALAALPEIDLLYSRPDATETFQGLYGTRATLVGAKHEMIDPYKYHLAIGNQQGPDILTERVTDALLGYAVPISFGCRNMADYFPADSFVDIDIAAPEAALTTIRWLLADPNDYARRLPAVIEARRRVMEELNLIAMIAKIVADHRSGGDTDDGPRHLYGRRLMRLRNPRDLLGYAVFKIRNLIPSVGE